MGTLKVDQSSKPLVGRDTEINTIYEVFQAVKLGSSEFAVIDGEPGVGKTTLAESLAREFAKQDATIISGKFDVNHRNVPFSAIIHGLTKYFDAEVLRDKEKTEAMRARLNLFLSGNAGLLARVLPILGRLVSIESSSDIVSVSERKDRLNLALANLFAALVTPGKPLVLFLDDLHWADSASRQLIETLLIQSRTEGVMILATVRNSELTEIHPVKRLFQSFEESEIPYTRLSLNNLNSTETGKFLEQRFAGRPEFLPSLVKLVLDKTQGNPFYMEQFFSVLTHDGVLAAVDGQWRINEERARRHSATDNVIDLVSKNVSSLEPFTREVLLLGSCFGKRFTVADLSLVGRWSPLDVERALANACEHGLVSEINSHVPEGIQNWKFSFSHDRIFETIYAMMDPEKRAEGHYKIGTVLYKRATESEREKMAFFLAHQFRAGSTHIQSREQRFEVANLNLVAARKARESINFESASIHVNFALEIMPEMNWRDQGDLLYALYMIKAETTAFNGDSETATELFELILRNIDDDRRKSEVIRLHMSIKFFFGEYQDGVELGIEGLRQMGVPVAQGPSALVTRLRFFRVKRLLRKFGANKLEDVKRLPSNPVDSLYNALSAPAFFHNNQLCAAMAIDSCDRLVKEGAVDGSWQSLCVFAGLLAADGKYKESCELGDIALKCSQFSEDMERAAVGMLAPSVSLVWSVPLRHLLDLLQINFDFAQQVGASYYAGLSALECGAHAVFSGAPLEEVDKRIWNFLKYMTQHKNLNCYDNLLPSQLAVNALRLGKSSGAFSQPDSTDLEMLKQMGSFNANNPVAWYALNRLWIDYFMGNYESAFKCHEICKLFQGMLPFSYGSVIRDVFSCLLLATNYHKAGLGKLKFRREMRDHLRRLRDLAAFFPENYAVLYLLAKGEFDLRVRGKVKLALREFNNAIEKAGAFEQIHWQALGEELKGRLLADSGDPEASRESLRNAFELYLKWGATAKAEQLRNRVTPLTVAAANGDEFKVGVDDVKKTA